MANVVVVGAQWGDEGKGKIVDVLSEHAEVVVRYAGGANAGHTLMVGEKRLISHLIPSGVLHPGTRCLLGEGMVIDPEELLDEIAHTRSLGLLQDESLLGVSERAHVIFSYHKALDAAREAGQSAIGTTKRGIGPCYEDKAGRRGIQMWLLTEPDALRPRLERAVAHINPELERRGHASIDPAPLVERYAALGERISPFLCDSSRAIAEAMERGSPILFEGAQGALLDIDHGTYPHVTSSSPAAGGACTGAGVGPTRIDSVVGIVKAYQTRVGGGPFPTELTGEVGETLRERGQEYGATTGRPRRCGWLDIASLRRSVRINGLTGIALTKLDVLSGLLEIKICVGYELDGKKIDELPPGERADRVTPIYETMPGFDQDLSGTKKPEELGSAAQAYLARISELTGVPLCMISVGPRRSETIHLIDPFDR